MELSIKESFLSLLPSLTLTSARMMLTVVISICIKDPTQSALKVHSISSHLSPLILNSLCLVRYGRDFSSSSFFSFFSWRIIGNCMHGYAITECAQWVSHFIHSSIDYDLRNGVNREDGIHTLLDSLTVATKGSSLLRLVIIWKTTITTYCL